MKNSLLSGMLFLGILVFSGCQLQANEETVKDNAQEEVQKGSALTANDWKSFYSKSVSVTVDETIGGPDYQIGSIMAGLTNRTYNYDDKVQYTGTLKFQGYQVISGPRVAYQTAGLTILVYDIRSTYAGTVYSSPYGEPNHPVQVNTSQLSSFVSKMVLSKQDAIKAIFSSAIKTDKSSLLDFNINSVSYDITTGQFNAGYSMRISYKVLGALGAEWWDHANGTGTISGKIIMDNTYSFFGIEATANYSKLDSVLMSIISLDPLINLFNPNKPGSSSFTSWFPVAPPAGATVITFQNSMLTDFANKKIAAMISAQFGTIPLTFAGGSALIQLNKPIVFNNLDLSKGTMSITIDATLLVNMSNGTAFSKSTNITIPFNIYLEPLYNSWWVYPQFSGNIALILSQTINSYWIPVINNFPPNQITASITTPSADTVVEIGRRLTFSAYAYDSDTKAVLSYKWDFGDGTSSTLKNDSHLYQKAAQYKVLLTATDNTGATGTCSRNVLVFQAPATIKATNTITGSCQNGYSKTGGGSWHSQIPASATVTGNYYSANYSGTAPLISATTYNFQTIDNQYVHIESYSYTATYAGNIPRLN